MKSEMEGADSVAITSELSIWKERAWDFRDGVIVVVAVKRSSVVVPFTVLLLDKYHMPSEITRINVGSFTEIDQTSTSSTNKLRERVFMFYNW